MANYDLYSITHGGNTYSSRDNTKIPLSGTNALSGDLVPASDGTINLGDTSHFFNSGYFQSLSKMENGLRVVYNNTRVMNISRYDTPTSNLYAQYILYKDKDSADLVNFQYGYETNLTSRFQLKVSSLVSGKSDLTINYRVYADGSKSIAPQTDNDVDLGSSSYNYKRVYTSAVYHGLNNGALVLSGGNAAANGAYLALYGASRTDGFQGRFDLVANGSSNYSLTGFPDGTLTWDGNYIRPTTNGVCYLGSAGSRWKEIWCTQSSLNSSSDKRLKQQIDNIDEKLLDAWENVEPAQYKFNDAVETKGKSARFHLGYASQDVQSALEKRGVNASEYGFFLYDEWEEKQEVSHEEEYQEEVETKDGKTETVTKTRKVIDQPYREKGDSYGLRYTECLVVECAFLRKKNKELQEQLDRLSARIDKLESGNNTK